MSARPRYKLRIKSLDFISAVNRPAQTNAKTLLIKRAPEGDEITATARYVKATDELGLAFFWAFTSTNADGTDHVDLQDDIVDADFMKAAMDFMTQGGPVDENHNEVSGAGRVVFAMPMDPEIAAAYGLVTKQTGLMVALKLAPDVLAKFKDGTYTGVSIGGTGERELLEKRDATIGKASLLTTAVLGHTHLVPCVDESANGTTSYANVFDPSMPVGMDTGHVHPWLVDDAGGITIGEALGHTHAIATAVAPIAKPTDDATEAIKAALTAKAASAKQHNTPHTPTPDDFTRFVDDIAKTDVKLARAWASMTSEPWATAWLAKADEAERIAKGNAPGAIEKAAEVALTKAEADLKSIVVAYGKTHKIANYDLAFAKATESDPATRDAYERVAQARELHKAAPATAASQPFSDLVKQLSTEIDTMVEAYSLQHNLDREVARERLTMLSSTYRDLVERCNEAVGRSQAAVQSAINQRAFDSFQAADDQRATQMQALRDKNTTPERRALNAHIAALAAVRNEPAPLTMAWAIMNDADAMRLWEACQR